MSNKTSRILYHHYLNNEDRYIYVGIKIDNCILPLELTRVFINMCEKLGVQYNHNFTKFNKTEINNNNALLFSYTWKGIYKPILRMSLTCCPSKYILHDLPKDMDIAYKAVKQMLTCPEWTKRLK